MTRFICQTCGTQHADADEPPETCAICLDDRQYVGWEGQRWTTLEELAADHRQRIGEEVGLLALGVSPAVAIDQRAFLLPTDAGNILWESLPLVTDEGVAAIEAAGGADRIVISHPHFYASMGEWSDRLGGIPITLHAADAEWIQRPHPSIDLWRGDTLRLSDDVTLLRCGGHFPGSTALHWARGPRPGGALFAGDALQVGMDRRGVSFMYSYPNTIPMRTSDVEAMRDLVLPYEFDDVFGYTWGRNLLGDAHAKVRTSFDRYLRAVRG
ncbi:MAG: MBL fold metallo-hydrolase [Sandaracinaceae bacterium]